MRIKNLLTGLHDQHGQALVANRNYLAKRRSNCNLFVLRISKRDDLLGMFTIEAYESITQIVAYARRFIITIAM